MVRGVGTRSVQRVPLVVYKTIKPGVTKCLLTKHNLKHNNSRKEELTDNRIPTYIIVHYLCYSTIWRIHCYILFIHCQLFKCKVSPFWRMFEKFYENGNQNSFCLLHIFVTLVCCKILNKTFLLKTKFILILCSIMNARGDLLDQFFSTMLVISNSS